jgi:hypothetical protein
MPGNGSLGQTSLILFQKITVTRFQFVAYRGRAPVVQDLVELSPVRSDLR